ncbi:putative dimethylallyl tryptophan synthase [Aspergillus steynii IBT 23096]|uniref:Putative dimethylallyl tryptophan synthase n=1 Tax=Aspergillus steynii IBT 23096 TaxID=1392250 RepID=A0A2I2GGM7_9EURO|nr:putative dimethylallyl tryptophan synthase [Aspergillus steynii IBT 23096]PLB52028.1 putative dimethylallyl tryptophan synthase [Aspergillus steynii IBT 23096]
MAADRSPWRVLGKALGFANRDQELWWLNTSPFFNNLLNQCGYEVHEQYHYLCFYHKHIVPVLGSFIRPGNSPDHLSCFTPEGYPFELSVNFQEDRSILRLGCGPVGPFAGTEHDPLNKFMTRELLAKAAQIDPAIDLRWFDYFESQFILPTEQARTVSEHVVRHGRQTSQLAFDLKNGGVVAKAYVFVLPKSIATGVPTVTLALNAIEGLADADFGSSLALLREYLLPGPDSDAPRSEVMLIGVDCVEPQSSRLKLYLVNTHLCLENMRAFWTLGGRLSDSTTMKGLEIAENLWNLLGLSDTVYETVDVDKLPLTFNYELKEKEQAPKPQLYLPVQGKGDEFVADALTEFFKFLDWQGFACRYKQDLISNFPCRDLKGSTAVQRWIAFSFTERTGVYLTIYFHAIGGDVGRL